MEASPRKWTFDRCPSCHSTKRIAQDLGKELKSAGKLGAHDEAFVNAGQTILARPGSIVLTASVLVSLYDICGNCGTYYCTYAELREVPVQARLPDGKIPDNSKFRLGGPFPG